MWPNNQEICMYEKGYLSKIVIVLFGGSINAANASLFLHGLAAGPLGDNPAPYLLQDKRSHVDYDH